MNRSARWILVIGAIPLLLSLGVSSATALGGSRSGVTSMAPFSDPNWRPQAHGSSSGTSMAPFSDLNWKPSGSVGTAPVGQSEPVGGGIGVPIVALIAGLVALAAGVGAFAGTLQFKRLRAASGG